MQLNCGIRSCGVPLTLGAKSRGLGLCTSCRNLLAGRLASLPRLYQACEQALEVQRQHPIRVVRGRRSTGICLDDQTMAVRSDTKRVLSSWCEMVVDEHGVTGPSSLDAEILTSFLGAHLNWLATHAAAADFADEIAALAADVKQVLNPVQVQTIDLAPCTRDGCSQTVRASISTVNQHSVPQVRCDAGHTWQPRQWLDLRHLLDLTACNVSAWRITP
jgi:hypothetical protein